MDRPNYILDAQSKQGRRVTSFALDMTTALLDFQDWVDALNIDNKSLWYADVFEFETRKHIGVVYLNDKNLAVIQPAPSNSRRRPFKRNKFFAKLKGELR